MQTPVYRMVVKKRMENTKKEITGQRKKEQKMQPVLNRPGQ